MWPDKELERQMLKDVERLEHLYQKDGFVLDSTTMDVCCHVKALLAEIDVLRSMLEELASGNEQCACGFRDVICAECGDPR